MNKLEIKRALSVAEAARYACVSRGTLELWLAKRLLPFEELPGQGNGRKKFRRIRRSDLDEFLDRHYKDKNQRKQKLDIMVIRDQIDLFPQEQGAALKGKS